MVWFWQTRQRSSEVIRVMRASSTGSAASGAASFAPARDVARATLMPTTIAKTGLCRPRCVESSGIGLLQLFEQGLDLGRERFLGERADVLHADDAALVDDERFGHAVDAEVDADAAFAVEQRGVVRVAEARQPAAGIGALVLVVEPIDRHEVLLRELDEQRMLLAAGNAP